jgi:hypothetical protein
MKQFGCRDAVLDALITHYMANLKQREQGGWLPGSGVVGYRLPCREHQIGGGGGGCRGWLTTLGAGALPKSRRRVVARNLRAEGSRESVVKVACGGGLQDVLGASMGVILGREGEATLGDAHVFTLGLVGVGRWVNWRDGGASRCHNSKIS